MLIGQGKIKILYEAISALHKVPFKRSYKGNDFLIWECSWSTGTLEGKVPIQTRSVLQGLKGLQDESVLKWVLAWHKVLGTLICSKKSGAIIPFGFFVKFANEISTYKYFIPIWPEYLLFVWEWEMVCKHFHLL